MLGPRPGARLLRLNRVIASSDATYRAASAFAADKVLPSSQSSLSAMSVKALCFRPIGVFGKGPDRMRLPRTAARFR